VKIVLLFAILEFGNRNYMSITTILMQHHTPFRSKENMTHVYNVNSFDGVKLLSSDKSNRRAMITQI